MKRPASVGLGHRHISPYVTVVYRETYRRMWRWPTVKQTLAGRTMYGILFTGSRVSFTQVGCLRCVLTHSARGPSSYVRFWRLEKNLSLLVYIKSISALKGLRIEYSKTNEMCENIIYIIYLAGYLINHKALGQSGHVAPNYALIRFIKCVASINPCPAELLQLYFSSFEAGIANAISSFKWRKILLYYEKQTCLKLKYWIN